MAEGMKRRMQRAAAVLPALFFLAGCRISGASAARMESGSAPDPTGEMKMAYKINKTDKEWREIMTPEQYRVLRQAGTERAFSGKYNDHYEEGTYVCGACGTLLFSSKAKYDHGTGWPSFTSVISEVSVQFHSDNSHGMVRTEVRCAACDSHLGHVFDDGPAPAHQHFCINSAALDFRPAGAVALRKSTAIATFAAGCFWGIEEKFRRVKGVISTRVGYTGGKVKNPTYELVCSDETGHAESVEIVFDPEVTSYDKLLDSFFLFHNPTQVNRQGPDVGTQYRSVVFYHDEGQKETALKMIEKLNKSGRFDRPIATQVVPAAEFYPAEDYHQQYYEKFRR